MLKLQFKNSAHPDVELSSKRVALGRDKSNNIVLDQAGISGFHAELHNEDGKVHIIDIGSTNGSFVNGKKVQGRVELKCWDKVRLDSIELELVDPDKRRPTEVHVAVSDADINNAKATQIRPAVDAPTKTTAMPAIRPRLIGESGVVSGRSFELKPPATIGRGEENSIVIEHDTVSTCHARITDDGSGWRIEDLGSTNGSYINNGKITSSPVKHGDKVRFGMVELRFDSGAPAAGKTTVMSTVSDDDINRTRTSVQPVVTNKGLPAWAYALGGFLVVGGVAAYFLFGDKIGIAAPKQVDAPLQAGKKWVQQLPNGRNSPATPIVADINGDGVLDVVVGDAHGFLTALDGESGKQIFEVDIADRILASLTSADLTGNGQADVIAATNSGGVIAVNGKGQPLWKAGGDLALGQVVNRPALIDINADKIPDVILPTMDKGLVALDGSRGWKIWDTADMMKGRLITSPIAADINGDGVTDFVAVTDSGQVIAASSQGKNVLRLWEAQVSPVAYASATFAKAGKSGLIVVATEAGIETLAADSGRPAWSTRKPAKFFASPLAVDLNGDGIADIIAVTVDGIVFALDGKTGDELWLVALGVGVKATPALHDFSGDNIADLVVLDESGAMRIIDGSRGRELTPTRTQIAGDAFVASPVLADVTGSGTLGIVSASGSGQIAVHLFNRAVSKGDAPWPVFLGNNRHALP